MRQSNGVDQTKSKDKRDVLLTLTEFEGVMFDNLTRKSNSKNAERNMTRHILIGKVKYFCIILV
jgi:hypothetical protein